MNASPPIASQAPEAGRLPSRVVTWPLSQAAFERVAEQWRRAGVWLSLWRPDGQFVAHDSDGSRFWNACWTHSESFRGRLGERARRVAERPADKPSPSDAPDHGPWAPELPVLGIPMRRRSRVEGVVLAAVVASERPGEGLARLCSQCELDAAVLGRQASATAFATAEDLDGLEAALGLTITQASGLDVAAEDCASLAANLDSTYEELNLVYRVSAEMGLPQQRARMLERVGRQMLDVSRAAALAFVLPEYDAPSGQAGAAERGSEDARIVPVGAGAPSVADLDRLAECLRVRVNECSRYVLLNDADAQPAFEWARDWLKHLVALPLRDNGRLLGVLFAINCVDDGDFTSIDVQLFRAVADRITAFLENQRLYDDLADLLMGLLHALVNSIDAKDPYTCGHSERVAHFSRALAQAADLSPVECQRVHLAGLLHDVGKIGVPDAILCKPGKLTKEEFDVLRKHPEIGVRILDQIRQIRDLMPGVLSHHERMDGRGYPHGLAGADIPRLGRIVCLADCFDAMTTSRTYRAALPLPAAVAEIRRCSGTQFDPELSERFVKLDLAHLMREAHEWSRGETTFLQIAALSHGLTGWPRPGEFFVPGPDLRSVRAVSSGAAS